MGAVAGQIAATGIKMVAALSKRDGALDVHRHCHAHGVLRSCRGRPVALAAGCVVFSGIGGLQRRACGRITSWVKPLGPVMNGIVFTPADWWSLLVRRSLTVPVVHWRCHHHSTRNAQLPRRAERLDQ